MADPKSQPDEQYADLEDESNETAPLTGGPSAAAARSYLVPKLPSYHLDVLGCLLRFVSGLVPSFITNHAATTPSKSGIAALDGLRGLACLFVFNEHYVICYQSVRTQVWIMRVPFIRLLWYGKAAVFLFFVISGYVLSYKPLRLVRSKSWLEFQKSISSSFLRRAMRLYLPCLIVSFIACWLTYFGFYDRSAQIYAHYRNFVFLKEEPPPRLGLHDQLKGYLANVEFLFSATIPFDKDTDVMHYFMYDDHQWTIPKEFRSSMVVFAVLVTTSRMRSLLRMALITVLCVYSIYTFRLYTSLFFAGMVCAELDLIRSSYYSQCKDALPDFVNEKHHTGSSRILHLPDLFYKVMWAFMFLVGVFMISSPQEIQETPNWLPTLAHNWGIVAVDDSILFVGSVFTVWSVAACPSLGPIFNNPFVAYLGKISYALYLVHGTVIKSLGYNILPWTLRLATWTPSSVELNLDWWNAVPNWQKVLAHLIGWAFVGTTCFWLSDLFWRFVDIPCVAFARSVETWVTKGADVDDFRSDSVPRSMEPRRRGESVAAGSSHVRSGSHFGGQLLLTESSPNGAKRKNG